MNGNLIINIIYFWKFLNNANYHCMDFDEIGIELIDGHTTIVNDDKKIKIFIE